jgi:hypothetical protein
MLKWTHIAYYNQKLRYRYKWTVLRSVVDPKFFFFFPGSYLDLNFGSGSGFESGSGLFMKNTLEIQMI